MRVAFYVLSVLVIFCQANAKSAADLGWFRLGLRSLVESPKYGCAQLLGKPGYACKDCDTIQVCDKNGAIDFEAKCKDISSKTPYCNPYSRSCEASDSCPVTASKFECEMEGFFPDPISCSKYVHCDGDNVPRAYTCPGKSKYDPSKTICSGTVSSCLTFSPIDGLCKGNAFKIVSHPLAVNLYVFCPPPGINEIKLKSCPKKDQKIDPLTAECEFTCTQEGFFADENTKTQYYVCIKEGSVFKSYIENCPTDTEFDGNKLACLSSAPSTTDPNLGNETINS